ncbi:MAG: transposase [Planctomycetaceae bacterium]|nr:transposase [Planctomycetaceae bacterium]
MELISQHIKSIQHLLSKQRGNVEIDDLSFFQALHSIAENGYKWRALPEKFANWNSIYCRFRYWIDRCIFDRIEKYLKSQAANVKGIKALSLDSTYIKVHPDSTGAPKKGPQSIGKSRGGLTTKIHSIVTDESSRLYISCCLYQ